MEWHEHSDESLIGYAASHLQFQGPAAMEMQRRLLIAIREFNATSGRQATTMIQLNRAMTVLTVAVLVVGVIQLWSIVTPNRTMAAHEQSATTGSSQVGQAAAGQASADGQGWFIESYENGVIAVRHEGSTYKATCNVSRSFHNAESITDPKNVIVFQTCDLPIDLVGHVVQPFGGQAKDSAGRVVTMWNVGSILALQRSTDEHTPWRMDEFIVTSVTAKR